MRRGLSVLIVLLMLCTGFIFSNAERNDMELSTLEGTYKVSVTITNPDVANKHLNNSFGLKGSLPSDIIEREFTVDIKYTDGKYLLYDQGDELKNSGLSTNKEFFIFNFKYEVKDSSINNILYEIKADLIFNDSTQSFDTINPKGKASLIYNTDGSYTYIGNGDFTMDKVGGKANEDSSKDKNNTSFEDREIPRGITFVKGIVEVKRAGTNEWIRARRNMPLNPGDIVRTGKNSYADLGCSSGEFTQATGSDIMLRPLSIITVPDKTLKVEKKSRVRVAFDDAMKNVYSLFGKEEFEIETPSAVCGIRGTDFIVDVDEEGNTTFLLLDGKITVKSKFDNSEVDLSPGQKIMSPVNKSLLEPEDMSNEDKADFTINPEDTSEDIHETSIESNQIEDDKEGKTGVGLLIPIIIVLLITIVLILIIRNKKKGNIHP